MTHSFDMKVSNLKMGVCVLVYVFMHAFDNHGEHFKCEEHIECMQV